MTLAIEILRDTRILLGDPAHWTKGHYARTASGDPCGPNYPGAACWCPAGALYRVAFGIEPIPLPPSQRNPVRNQARIDALCAVKAVVGTRTAAFPGPFNDDPETTHADLLNAVDKAIRLGAAR